MAHANRWLPPHARRFGPARRAARWRGLPLGALLLALWAAPLQAANLYRIDQRNGTVGFSVAVLGLFDVQGHFPRFAGEIELDTSQPERSRIDVTIDAAAVAMPLPEQVELLRSAAYFDSAHHPTDRFVSTAVEALTPTRFRIRGSLRIRGVTRPQELDAVLTDRHLDPDRQVEVADFLVTGQLSRGGFGMVADRTLLSDTVKLEIRIRLTVAGDTPRP